MKYGISAIHFPKLPCNILQTIFWVQHLNFVQGLQLYWPASFFFEKTSYDQIWKLAHFFCWDSLKNRTALKWTPELHATRNLYASLKWNVKTNINQSCKALDQNEICIAFRNSFRGRICCFVNRFESTYLYIIHGISVSLTSKDKCFALSWMNLKRRHYRLLKMQGCRVIVRRKEVVGELDLFGTQQDHDVCLFCVVWVLHNQNESHFSIIEANK